MTKKTIKKHKKNYTYKKICCDKNTHSSEKMKHCEDYKHDVASMIKIKTSIDHLIKINKQNEQNNWNMKSSKIIDSPYDHKLIYHKIFYNKKQKGILLSLNIEGMCDKNKYKNEYENRKNKLMNIITQNNFHKKKGIIFVIQELFLKKNIKGNQEAYERLIELSEFLNPSREYGFAWDKYTGGIIYDKQSWRIKDDFSIGRKNSKKKSTFYKFKYNDIKSPLQIVNIHLKSILINLNKNKKHVKELYDIMNTVFIEQNIKGPVYFLGDHNNTQIDDIYEHSIDQLNNKKNENIYNMLK